MSSSRSRRRWVVAIAVLAAVIMGAAAVTGAALAQAAQGGAPTGLPLTFAPPASTPSPAAPTPLVASGPMVSLGLGTEVGSIIGGALNPSVAPPLGQEDLVVVTLPIQHLAQLEAFLSTVSDPYSPWYAHFLTDSEFTQAYGPALADQLGVSNY